MTSTKPIKSGGTLKTSPTPSSLTTTAPTSSSISTTTPTSSTSPASLGANAVSYEANSVVLLHYLKEQHDRFLSEIEQLAAPLRRSLALSSPSQIGCRKCDRRAGLMDTTPLPAILRMRDHLTFIPPVQEEDHGFFCYDRLYTSHFKYYPSGEQEARASARRVITRLNQGGGALALEASYKLVKSFLSGHSTWLSSFDLQAPKLTYLATIAILSIHNDTSGVRLCLVPTRVFTSLQGKPLTYNDCVTDLPATFPKPLKFALQDLFCYGSLQADIQAMYNSVRYSADSARQTLTFCLRTPEGRPTMSLAHAQDPALHCLKSSVLEWGLKDAPHCAQQALAQCVPTYRKHHPEEDAQPLPHFLLNCVEDMINFSVHMDDLNGAISFPMLDRYAKLTNQESPVPDCDCKTEDCGRIISDGIWLHSCPTATISDKLWEDHQRFMLTTTQAFLQHLGEVLCSTLSFCGFRLKFLRSPQCDPKAFDTVINLQQVTVPSDEDIGVIRPTAQELRAAICKMKTRSELHFIKAPDSLPESVVHLSHRYDGRSVALNITHLVITCLIGKSRKKSPELYSFKDYQQWKDAARPSFCKRSLFSLLHANFCFTGRWLCLYRMLMKILIRTTLIQQPNLTWDAPLEEQVVAKMELAIKLYFVLTKEVLEKPPDFNSYLSVYFIYLFTDASAQVMAQTFTILSLTNLHGGKVVKAQHLKLTASAAHVAALSVPHLELLSLLRGVLGLQEVLEALAGVGIQVAPGHRRAGVDSKVILAQVRSPANNFVKRTAHAVARIQLLLSELQMSPFLEVGHQNPAHPEVTFFPDLLTKVSWSITLDQLVNTYKRIMNTNWMTKGHPMNLPGWDNKVALPSLTDADWMHIGGVLEGELDVFRKTIMSHPVHTHGEVQHQELIHSAATLIQRAAETDKELLDDDVEPEPVPVPGDDGPVYDMEEFLDLDVIEEENTESTEMMVEKEHPLDPVDVTEDEATLATDDPSDVEMEKHEEEPVADRADTEDKQVHEQPLTTPGDTVTLNQLQPASTSEWRTQLEQLQERFHSRGLGSRGVIPILTNVLQFGVKLRANSKLGLQGRAERQAARSQQYQARLQGSRHPKLPASCYKRTPFKDEHFMMSENVDLSSSSLGNFDSLWCGPPPHHEPTRQDLSARAFQHLLGLSHSTKWVKGFSHQSLQTHHSESLHILRGRRQRDFKQPGMYEVRLRPVQENTILERLLLWAAHRYSLGQGIHRALNGLHCLNVYITQAERKLTQISAECSSCCRRRAALGKTSDKMKVDRKGPTENLLLARRWLQGWTIVQSDVHGPIYVHFSPGTPARKQYIICFLELPLKKLTSVLVASLSACDLLLALETYALQRGRACDIFYSDYGANYSRFHDQLSELEPLDEEEESRKSVAWRDMLKAHYNKQKTSTSAIRFSQGRHEVLGPVEQCQYQIKRCLHSFNIHRREDPLTFQQWTFLLSCVAQVIATRPLLIDHGRVYSPTTILRLLGEAGRGEGQHGLTFHTQGARNVTRDLNAKQEEIKKLRCDIASVLLAHLVKKYFLDIQPRNLQLRKRGPESLCLGDIFLCPRLFKETANVTASLLQLKQLGMSHNHGLFKRTSTHQGQRVGYVGRGFRELYFIARGNRCTQLGDPNWQAEELPTFQLGTACPQLDNQLQGFDTFAEVETPDSATGSNSVTCANKGGAAGGEGEGGDEGAERGEGGGAEGGEGGARTGAKGEGREVEEENEKTATALPVVTRSGRTIRPPQRLQV